MKEKIENALQRSAAAQKAWDELYALMANSGLQMERSYPSIQGSTLEELNSRLNATFFLSESLRSIDDNGAVLGPVHI